MAQISDAESEVMKVFWDRSPRTAQEVITELQPRKAWKPKTIKTLLNRLVGKGALGFRRQGKTYSYFCRISREEFVRTESKSFLNKMFGGALTPMIAAFIQQESLSAEEIGELKRILEEKEHESSAR